MPTTNLVREKSQRLLIEGEYDIIPSAEMKVLQTTKKPKKNVSFYDFVSVRATLHYYNMTDKEISSYWYSHREMNIIRRSLIYQLTRMTALKPLAEEFFTPRGLENRTRKGREGQRANELNSINAVLDEQDLQLMEGFPYHPEAIRAVYSEHSQKCTLAAQKLGRCDEIEANRIHEDNNNSSSDNEDSSCSSFSWQQEKNLEKKAMRRKQSRRTLEKEYLLYSKVLHQKKLANDEIKNLRMLRNR